MCGRRDYRLATLIHQNVAGDGLDSDHFHPLQLQITAGQTEPRTTGTSY